MGEGPSGMSRGVNGTQGLLREKIYCLQQYSELPMLPWVVSHPRQVMVVKARELQSKKTYKRHGDLEAGWGWVNGGADREGYND